MSKKIEQSNIPEIPIPEGVPVPPGVPVTRRRYTKPRRNSGIQALFFVLVILYSELLLRAFDKSVRFFSPALLRIFLFSVAAGLLLYVLLDLLPWPKFGRTLAGILIFLGSFYLSLARCCVQYFGTYFTIGYMAQMSGDAVGDFSQNIGSIVWQNLPFILLAFLPVVLFFVVRKLFFWCRIGVGKSSVVILAIFLVLQVAGGYLSQNDQVKNHYTYDFQANTAVREFGAVTTLRLEAQYAIFGIPETPPVQIDLPILPPPTEPAETKPAVEEESTEPTEPEVIPQYNVLDIDFAALQANASNDSLAASHQYFGSLTPSMQNEYTGMFEGKNLILITAEAFSPYAISPELTPTLYKLSNESFVFTNYYQPDWHQSTAGGEFAVMTGLMPTWVGSDLALKASSKVSMPYTLGWAFREQGYKSLAYHNNSYTYYDRHKTHPNLGYEWTAVGNGLKLQKSTWPNSDLDMILATADGYIQDYVENGTKFHTYYMTVSGHANYNWGGNQMCSKNKAAAQAAYPYASTEVQAYIACNLELEYAMASLLEKLETAGIADETVIVLTSDHYPYALTEGKTDYYVELSGVNDTVNQTSRYKNTLILWCGGMEERVVVDTPCSSVDIVPTLYNLFGLSYDSRLYSGRDVFATNYEADQVSTCMPLVVFPMGNSYSWITAAGTYEAFTDTFTPNPGISVSEDYVKIVSQLASAKYTYAKKILQQDYYATLK